MNVVGHTTSILVLLAPEAVCYHGTAIDLLAALLFAGERDLCNSTYASHTKLPFLASMLCCTPLAVARQAASARKC
jgi:hypothetical protein